MMRVTQEEIPNPMVGASAMVGAREAKHCSSSTWLKSVGLSTDQTTNAAKTARMHRARRGVAARANARRMHQGPLRMIATAASRQEAMATRALQRSVSLRCHVQAMHSERNAASLG